MKIFLILLNVIIVLLILCGLIFGGVYLYKMAHYTHITAVFDEAEPIPPGMKVFYKGFLIGKVTKVIPNEDYTAVHMHIVLFPEEVKIPDNISVKIREYKDDFDYVDIVSPELASTEFLKNGSEVKGAMSQNAERFFNSHAENGTLDLVIENVITMLDGVNKTVAQTNELVADIRKTFDKASPSLIESSKNIASISTNFSGTSLKINNSVNQASLDRTMENLEKSSDYVECLVKSLNCAAKDLPETMDRVNDITKDVQGITSGVNNTLQKPFGGVRLIMGAPVSKCSRCEK